MVTKKESDAASQGYQVVALRELQYNEVLKRLNDIEQALLELKELVLRVSEANSKS